MHCCKYNFDICVHKQYFLSLYMFLQNKLVCCMSEENELNYKGSVCSGSTVCFVIP